MSLHQENAHFFVLILPFNVSVVMSVKLFTLLILNQSLFFLNKNVLVINSERVRVCECGVEGARV